MLTVTRKVGESIQVGDNITIEVREIRKNQVRIGILAPRDVQIMRTEVLEKRGLTVEDLGGDDEEVSFG